MSVATQLGLDPASTALVELEQHWASWVDQFPPLARAGDLRSFRGWLAAVEPDVGPVVRPAGGRVRHHGGGQRSHGPDGS